MSGIVDIRRILLAVMAAAALVVVLAVPYKAQAATDCSSAGTDPTAAQYCPPTQPEEEEQRQEECTEDNSGNSGSGANSENCNESTSTTSTTPSAPAPAASEGGSLPFTGEELPTLLAIAAAFIGAGVALQRLSRPRTERS